MNIINRFGYYFFAPNGRFNPCGMFTSPHLIAVAVCVFLIIFCLFYFLKTNRYAKIHKMLRGVAIILTMMEIIKISHSFIYGDLHLDAWFPLSYCGLFIFATWMCGFGKKSIKRAGEVYIAYGCPIAGICFLIFPTTSLMSFPVWHYFSLYSLFFHTVMIFMGILCLIKEKTIDRKNYFSYALFIICFSLPAIFLNSICGSNLMNLREPYNIPIEFLQKIYSSMPFLYTLLVLIGYLTIPFIVGIFTRKLKTKKVLNLIT